MALYQPLRDAFNDLNKMIVDSQQWDEQHAAREADNEYRHAVQMANAKQQNFQNDMAVKAYDLKVRGEDRAAANAEQRILENKRNYDLSSKIHQLNKDKFKETQEVNDMNATKLQLDIEALEKPTIPIPLDFNGIISPRLAKNARFMGELNEWTGSQNIMVGEDLKGMSPNENGEYRPTKISPNKQAEFAPFLQGLIAKYDNPNENAKEDMVILKEYHTELSKVKSVNGGYNHAEVAQARRQMKVIESEIESQKKVFTAETAKESYGRRSKEMYGTALWLRQRGLEDDADGFESGALKMLDRAIAADKTGKGQRIETWHRELVDNASVPGPSLTFDLVNEQYKLSEMVDDPDNPGQKILQERTAPQVEDFGLTTDEPTPVKATKEGQGSPRDDISVKDMTDFRDAFKTEGMNAMTASNVSKPIKRDMGVLATVYKERGDFKGTSQPNNLSKQAAVDFQKNTEMTFHNETSREFLNNIMNEKNGLKAPAFAGILKIYGDDLVKAEANKMTDRAAFLNRRMKKLLNMKKNKVLQRMALKEFAEYTYQSAWRDEIGDPLYNPYIPNKKTKGMLTGVR